MSLSRLPSTERVGGSRSFDTTMNAPPDTEKELARTIKDTTFRPRVVNGQFGEKQCMAK
jgi:hypothetical protein